MHEQNIIWSKKDLVGTTHEQTIICKQLFTGHVVGSWQRKIKGRKNYIESMIITNTVNCKIPLHNYSNILYYIHCKHFHLSDMKPT